MQKLFEDMDNKNKTLASWTRERVESVVRLQAAWERLQSLVDNHKHLISKQVDIFSNFPLWIIVQYFLKGGSF